MDPNYQATHSVNQSESIGRRCSTNVCKAALWEIVNTEMLGHVADRLSDSVATAVGNINIDAIQGATDSVAPKM